MRNVFSLTVALIYVLCLGISHAKAEPQPATTDRVALEALVNTLEDDTARTAFIAQLKVALGTLEQTGAQQAAPETLPPIAPLSQSLGIDTHFFRAMTAYKDFLARHDVTGSLIGQMAMSLATFIVFAGALILGRRLVRNLMRSIDQAGERFHLPQRRLRTYGRFLRAFISITGWMLFVYTLGIIWNAPTTAFFQSPLFTAALKGIMNIGFIILLAVCVWEAMSGALNHVFHQADKYNATRMRTILPVLQNILFIVFVALFALMLLSELGVNIAPLLAGAGIVGVAVGFGAQNMVKDFLTGFTLIFEDIVRVGDIVTVAGHQGMVELITLRKIQLRDTAGVVYTIPFSQITTVENATKGFSFYVMDIAVDYNSDVDAVCNILREVDAALRADPQISSDMLEPIEIMGLDRFTDNALIIKARLKTAPLKQWAVGRAFNKAMKIAFDKHGINIPYPHQVQVPYVPTAPRTA